MTVKKLRPKQHIVGIYKSIKITINNPNNPKLQKSPHITNNQITQKSPNNTKKIKITQEKGPIIISSKAQK